MGYKNEMTIKHSEKGDKNEKDINHIIRFNFRRILVGNFCFCRV